MLKTIAVIITASLTIASAFLHAEDSIHVDVNLATVAFSVRGTNNALIDNLTQARL